MKYISTRGAGAVSFENALLNGLAPDGGLYVPEAWPAARADWAATQRAYSDLAADVAALFGGDLFTLDEWRALMAEAYARFYHPEVAPLRDLGDGLYLLELFHGPTCAFKDFAMQVLARAFDRVLGRRGIRRTILVATSGDTGAAAVEALKGMDNLSLVVLHPKGRVSDAQRKQMTTCTASNVRNIAVEGTFDACQTIVKQLFADRALAAEMGLGAVNSINWVRIVAQVPYYIAATAKLGAPASFAVPTGNFGDIFAGFVARKLGLETGPLAIATNANDILHRALETGRYTPASALATVSPAMDIQLSSNFERLLFECIGRDADRLRDLMQDLTDKGEITIPDEAMNIMRATFTSARVDDAATHEEMARVFRDTGVVIDPHTAVGVAAARNVLPERGPRVVLSTAHPSKFPETVIEAIGHPPQVPPRLHDALEGEERFTTLPADLGAVKTFLRGE